MSDSPLDKLPVDPLGILLRLWKHRRIFLFAIPVILILAILAGLFLGQRTYEAETTLLFTATPNQKRGGVYKTPTLYTHMHLVKLPGNIMTLRDRLKIPVGVQTLSRAFSVRIQRDTSLMFIRARADSPEKSALMANTMSDVFLEMMVKIRQAEANQYVEQYTQRLRDVNKTLEQSEKVLEEFSQQNQVVDLDKEAQWTLEQYTATDMLLVQAKIEKEAVDLQLKDMDTIIGNLKEQVKTEKTNSQQLDGVGQAKIKADRLREKIFEDQSRRANQAKLVQLEIDLKRTQQMFEEGMASSEALEKAEAAYKSQLAVTEDTEQIKQWKEELQKLDQAIVPDSSETATMPLLRDMLVKSFELQLQKSTLQDKVSHLQEALKNIENKLNQLPSKQKRYINLKRAVSTRAMEQKDLEEKIQNAMIISELNTPDFAQIAKAKPPILPIASTRRFTAIVVAFAGGFAVLLIVIALVLLDTTIITAGDFKTRLNLGVPVVIPRLPSKIASNPKTLHKTNQFEEIFNYAAIALNQKIRHQGNRIVVSGIKAGDGISTVVFNLAISMGKFGTSVLILDLRTRSSLAHLSGETVQEKQIVSSDYDEVDLFIAGDQALDFVEKSGDKLKNFLAQHQDRYGVIFILPDPVSISSRSILVAEAGDSIIWLIRAGHVSARKIRDSIDKVTIVEKPVIQCFLNDVNIDFDWRL